jgi:predicted acetyltransferase
MMNETINNQKICLVQVAEGQKMALERIMELYVYDFTEYMDLDVGEDGLFNYPLQDYWDSPATHRAYFIQIDGKLAGCVLQYTYINDQGFETQTIGEFFVMKKYQRDGIGTAVAKMILNRFPGNWLIYESKKNIPAQNFWRKIITEYTHGSYKEYYVDGKPHQTFIVPT